MDVETRLLREEIAQLRAEVTKLQASISTLNHGLTSLRARFVAGLITGLGTVLGATLLVSLLLWILRPLASLPVVEDVVRPAVRTIETRQPPAGAAPDADQPLPKAAAPQPQAGGGAKP